MSDAPTSNSIVRPPPRPVSKLAEHFPWIMFSVLICLPMVFLAWQGMQTGEHIAETEAGRALGWMALSFLVISLLLSMRKRVRGAFIGRGQTYYRIHIYFGAYFLIATVLHTGMRAHGGLLIILLLLAILVALGGFAGVAIQMVAPRLLTLSVRFEHKPEDLEDVLDELRETAEKIGSDEDVSSELRTYYERVVSPILASPLLALESIFHTAPGASRRARAYQHIVSVLHPEERPRLDELQDMLTQRDEILIQRYLTGLLRGWLSFHIPIAGALIAALAVHVWSVFYF